MAIELPALPWAKDALAPHISAETIEYHYGKHHAGYVKKLNAAIEGTDLASKSLVDIIRAGGGTFNNAAQVWNHTFYWNSMTPGGGGAPDGLMGEWLNKSFGNYKTFREAFIDAARSRFASGWTWLVPHDGKLDVISTANAKTPIVQGIQPLLVLDVWEHAYYIDYRNARPKYLDEIWKLVNWDFVATNFG